MILETIPVGSYRANCYIAGCERTREIIIIDPGDEAEKIFYAIRNNKYVVKYITFTHNHFDHTGALKAVEDEYGISAVRNLKTLNVGDVTVEVIKTPGHSADGISLHTNGFVFTGDTLFYGSVGRTDLPTGNHVKLENSIRKLYELPDNTVVYPGHGQQTTIGFEKLNNPFFRA